MQAFPTFLLALIIFFIPSVFSANTDNVPNTSLAAPSGLLTELLRWPELAVITDDKPEFSWVVPDGVRHQYAYRILVASSPDVLKQNVGDLWDTQKVKSDQHLNIEYQGKPLLSKQGYWWKIQLWSSEGVKSAFSRAQHFVTANFKRDETDEKWPGESLWVKSSNGQWVSEDRQTAVFQNIVPSAFKKVTNNVYLADFTKAAFGTLKLTITAEQAQPLTLYLGERLTKQGLINKHPGHSFIGYQKLVIAVKQGTHEYQTDIPSNHSNSPHHQKLAPFYPEVMPFRYAEVHLPQKGVEVKSLFQQALYYPFDDSASYFLSDNQILNQVWELSKYTLKATPFLSIYADGNRERMPYEADAYIQQLGHYNVDREFSVARYTAKFLLHHASWPTEWHMHMVMMAWQDYMHTANSEFLADYYSQLKAKTLYQLAREDGLISSKTDKVTSQWLKKLHYSGNKFRDIVDWPKGTKLGEKQARNAGPTPEGERDGYVFTDYNTVVNAFHFHVLNLMSNIANVLGKQQDQKWFKDRALQVQVSMLQHMFDPARGIFTDGIGIEHGSLHANMFSLAFNLVPPEYQATVLAHIKSKGMASSVYGAQHLLDGLFLAGEADYGLSLLTSDSKRSWLNMIRVGSTMTTEAWDEYYKPNLTWNHAWGSAPANIIPRRLMGITPIEAGFKRFQIMPQPASLKSLALQVPTISGVIQAKLKVKDELKKSSWHLNIKVPSNTLAELWLPAEFTSFYINGEEHQAIKKQSIANSERVLFVLKSGEYIISAS